jgi:sigma-B regulation protein RsbU (phosphoserine phosphatase)
MPLVVSAAGELREIGTPQLLLGVATSNVWRDEQLALDPDATIVLHTDGVTDLRGRAGVRFGERRLHAVLRHHAQAPPDELLERLDAALADFQVGPQPDETAMISLRRQPVAKAPRARPAGLAGARIEPADAG